MAATYEEETARIMQLGQFVAAFAPKANQEMSYGPSADDQLDPEIALARDAAILDSFLALGRIARTSFGPPAPPAAKVEPKVGWEKAKVRAPR